MKSKKNFLMLLIIIVLIFCGIIYFSNSKDTLPYDIKWNDTPDKVSTKVIKNLNVKHYKDITNTGEETKEDEKVDIENIIETDAYSVELYLRNIKVDDKVVSKLKTYELNTSHNKDKEIVYYIEKFTVSYKDSKAFKNELLKKIDKNGGKLIECGKLYDYIYKTKDGYIYIMMSSTTDDNMGNIVDFTTINYNPKYSYEDIESGIAVEDEINDNDDI